MSQQTFALTEHTTEAFSLTNELRGKDYHFTIELDSVSNNDVKNSYSTKGFYIRQRANLYLNDQLLIEYTRMYGPSSDKSIYYKNSNKWGKKEWKILVRVKLVLICWWL
ncbi:hypothetical protein ABK040_003475 [Willaertia magna]